MAEARWIVCGRRGQRFCHDRGLFGGEVFWAPLVCTRAFTTTRIWLSNVAQDRVTNLWEIRNHEEMRAELGERSKGGRPLHEFFRQECQAGPLKGPLPQWRQRTRSSWPCWTGALTWPRPSKSRHVDRSRQSSCG